MLKLVLEPGNTLERTLQAASRQLEKVLEDSINEGYLRIRAYPRLESIISGGVIAGIASSLGVNPIFKVSVSPPAMIDIPTIILGYLNPDYKSNQISSTLISISPEAQAPPPPGAVYITGSGSVSALTGLILTESKGTYSRPESLLLLLSSTYYGGYVEKTGRFHGLDKIYYETLINSGINIEIINTLKVYNPDREGLCDAISKTIDPYYPGLTGDVESCRSLLKANELESLATRIVSSLSERELEKVALAILSHIQGLVKRGLEANDYIASILVLKQFGADARLIGNTLAHYIDAFGHYSPILSIVYNIDPVLQSLIFDHLESAKYFSEFISKKRPVKAKLHSWIKGYMVRIPQGFSPLLLWKAYRIMGLMGDEPLIADRGDEACVSALQLEEARGYGEARKLVNVKAVREEGLWLCLEKEKSA